MNNFNHPSIPFLTFHCRLECVAAVTSFLYSRDVIAIGHFTVDRWHCGSVMHEAEQILFLLQLVRPLNLSQYIRTYFICLITILCHVKDTIMHLTLWYVPALGLFLQVCKHLVEARSLRCWYFIACAKWHYMLKHSMAVLIWWITCHLPPCSHDKIF